MYSNTKGIPKASEIKTTPYKMYDCKFPFCKKINRFKNVFNRFNG